MHFNSAALTLGLATTLAAAVPVEDVTAPASFPPGRFPDMKNQPIGIAGLPQPVQDCLKRKKPAPKEDDPKQPPEQPPQEGDKASPDFPDRWWWDKIFWPKASGAHHSSNVAYDLENQTVNKICKHGEKKMSGARSFRRFEKHVFAAINRCNDVDMQPLEDLFWDVNHQCHVMWAEKSRKPQDGGILAAAEEAEEKDENGTDDEE